MNCVNHFSRLSDWFDECKATTITILYSVVHRRHHACLILFMLFVFCKSFHQPNFFWPFRFSCFNSLIFLLKFEINVNEIAIAFFPHTNFHRKQIIIVSIIMKISQEKNKFIKVWFVLMRYFPFEWSSKKIDTEISHRVQSHIHFHDQSILITHI